MHNVKKEGELIVFTSGYFPEEHEVVGLGIVLKDLCLCDLCLKESMSSFGYTTDGHLFQIGNQRERKEGVPFEDLWTTQIIRFLVEEGALRMAPYSEFDNEGRI